MVSWWMWLGCAQPALTPSAQLGADDPVWALPAEHALIGRADVPALLAHPALATRARDQDALGVAGGVWGLDRVAVGCGRRGCVVLADGELDGLSLVGLGAKALPDGAERLDGPGGWIGRVEHLAPGKVALGDARALRELRQTHRQRSPTLTPESVQPLVPEGQLWIAARRPQAVQRALEGWLSGLRGTAARRALARLALHGDAIAQLDEVLDAVAVAVDVEREVVVVRGHARTVAAARWAAAGLRAWLAAGPLPVGFTDAQVGQQGEWLELELQIDPAALVAAMEAA